MIDPLEHAVKKKQAEYEHYWSLLDEAGVSGKAGDWRAARSAGTVAAKWFWVVRYLEDLKHAVEQAEDAHDSAMQQCKPAAEIDQLRAKVDAAHTAYDAEGGCEINKEVDNVF